MCVVPQPNDDRDVMASLPRTRPPAAQRRARPSSGGRATPPPAAASAGAKPQAQAAAAKAEGGREAEARRRRSRRQGRAKPQGRREGRKAKPKTAAEAAVASVRPSKPGRAQACRRAGYAGAGEQERAARRAASRLVTTAVQAAGELAQIGASVAAPGRPSALTKLPRPVGSSARSRRNNPRRRGIYSRRCRAPARLARGSGGTTASPLCGPPGRIGSPEP